MPVREAKLSDRADFQRLYLAALIEERANGSDVLPTGKSVQFGLDYFNSYTNGSRFGVCLLWCPEGEPASPQGFILVGERWTEDDYDRDVGRTAWLFNIYSEPSVRSKAAVANELITTGWRIVREMGFDTVTFSIPEGCPSGPLAKRFGASPRGVWYNVALSAQRTPEE